MARSTQRFKILLFDGKINFMIWQSTIEDLLVQRGLDQTLENESLTSIKEIEWTKIQRRVVSTIWLVLAPEIKYSVLKETTPKTLWKKLENIYASKSLINRLYLKMELYQLWNFLTWFAHPHQAYYQWQYIE